MDGIGRPVDKILKTYGDVNNFRLENVLDLHENFVSTEIDVDNDLPIWESQFILVKHIEFISNIYRPPFDNNGRENVIIFIEELNPIISHFNKSCRGIVIIGCFNINLLHAHNTNEEHYGEFLALKSHFQHVLMKVGTALSLMTYFVN